MIKLIKNAFLQCTCRLICSANEWLMLGGSSFTTTFDVKQPSVYGSICFFDYHKATFVARILSSYLTLQHVLKNYCEANTVQH